MITSLFTPTPNDEPNYFDEELEPEKEYDSDSDSEAENMETNQIAFGANVDQSQSLFPTESQLVDRLLRDRKAQLTEEIERYRDLPKQIFTSCK